MAQCLTPFTKRNEKTMEIMDLPCGKCHECLSRRISGWSFRLMQEYNRATSAYFVTFTYNTDHVPITARGFMSLQKSHVQNFFKTLRNYATKHKYNQGKITYYLCGEYGSKTNRPHYHAIIFNAPINGIEKSWQYGDIHIGDVNEASVGYTLKYMCKDPTNPIPAHKNDDRLPIFSLMSKGIGANYLTTAKKSWHKKDLQQRMYIPIADGKKIAMPRYYKEKIYNQTERSYIAKHIKSEKEKETPITEQQRLLQIEANQTKSKNKTLNRQKL